MRLLHPPFSECSSLMKHQECRPLDICFAHVTTPHLFHAQWHISKWNGMSKPVSYRSSAARCAYSCRDKIRYGRSINQFVSLRTYVCSCETNMTSLAVRLRDWVIAADNAMPNQWPTKCQHSNKQTDADNSRKLKVVMSTALLAVAAKKIARN